VPPTITSEIEGVSFPDLLSTGKSNFEEGNGADRVKNIDLSLGAFHSVIVPAGESFSMNRTTGWITEDKGYTKTKVIYGGAVGTGVGGGVCQTSTTLYRAVINAGLPVTERRPHTLDVSYYHKYGYGLDAAVYTVARKDFQFVNDTGSPILINTYIAPSDEAIVEIYGTSDGRTVELKNIPTGIRNYKKWNWFVKWPEKEEKRVIDSIYLR
jgi:vancomycin resistance protein YoaR